MAVQEQRSGDHVLVEVGRPCAWGSQVGISRGPKDPSGSKEALPFSRLCWTLFVQGQCCVGSAVCLRCT